MNTNDFPETTKKYLDEVILDRHHPLLLYGSISQPTLLFKGDVDMLQMIKTSDRERVFNELKKILEHVENNKDSTFFVSEIKFGEVKEIKDEIEKLLKEGKKKELLKYITEIKTPDQEIIKLIKAKETNENKYQLADLLREYYVLRWSASDILKGKADYLLQQSNELIFKVDFQFFNTQRFIETSNFVQFRPFKPDEKSEDVKFISSLKDNIKKVYYSDCNYYKTLKRLYTYYKQLGDKNKVEFFENIINNPILGNIYLILTEFKVLETIYEFNKPDNKKYKQHFKTSIDSLKNNTLYFDEEEMIRFNKMIDILKEMEPKTACKPMGDIIKNLKELLNKRTISVLKEHNFDLEKEIKKF